MTSGTYNSLPTAIWKLKGRGGELMVTERRERLKITQEKDCKEDVTNTKKYLNFSSRNL